MVRAWLLFAGLLCSASVHANDSAYAEPNGGIVLMRQADVRMVSEVLTLSEAQVTVDYVFQNLSQRALDVPMAFPMPAQNLSPEGLWSTVEDFRLWVNGKQQPTTQRWVFLDAQGRDLHTTVTQLGWTEKELVEWMVENISDTPMPAGRRPLPKDWFDAEGGLRVTAHEYFLWTQRFPAGASVRVRHTYKPGLTTGVPLPVDVLMENYGETSCVDADMRRSVQRLAKNDHVAYANLRYILTTANNWQGPIGDFTLRIRKTHPRQLVSLCLPDDETLQKRDPLTFELRRREYRPRMDLNILFVAEPTY